MPSANESSPLTLRDLITAVVRSEVQAFQSRQSEQRLQQFLGKDAIAQGLSQGKETEILSRE